MPYRITSARTPGHYRGGRFHSDQGRTWPDDAFTPEQLAALEGDPDLEIRAVAREASAAPQKEATAKPKKAKP